MKSNPTRQGIENWLTNAELTEDWQYFEKVCTDDFDGRPWSCSPWARRIGGKKVAAVCSHEGEFHPIWRLYADGKFAEDLPDVVTQMGSITNVMHIAEERFAA